MKTTEMIRQHLQNLDKQEIFTTRDMLNYGKRSAVDQALYRMVQLGKIVRLAWGVFIQNHEDLVIPSEFKVAHAKAKAFRKTLYITGNDAARKIGILKDERRNNRSITFNTDGPSSSFKYLTETTVRFKSICSRKLEFQNRPVGLVIRALWSLGEDGLKSLESSLLNRAMSFMSRDDREVFRKAGDIMPHWMVSFFTDIWGKRSIPQLVPVRSSRLSDDFEQRFTRSLFY